jgi:tetratricopeptide (TPR) repeat protein
MKIFLILLIIITHTNTVHAIKDIPLPDMSHSEASIVEAHNNILKNFNLNKSKIKGTQLGTSYGEMGMFYQAHEFFEAAKVAYLNAIEASPYDYRWPYLYAFIESSMGNFESAKKYYQIVLNIDSEYLPAKIRWAEIELENGEFEHAAQLYNEILSLAPTFAKAYVGLGTINLQNGKSKKAIEYFQKALKLQPKANQLNYFIAQAYLSLGDSKSSKQYMNTAGQRPVVMYDKVLQNMRLYSVSAVYYSQAALNAFMQEDYSLAEQLIKRSEELDPENINPKFTLMNIYISTNRIDQAYNLAKSLLIKYPQDDRVTYSLGLIEESKGNDVNAIKWYDKTLLLNPKHKAAQLVLANALLRMKMWNKALSAYRKSQLLDTQNPYPIYEEAVILSHLKVCDKSIDKFLESLKKLSKENFTYLTAFVKTVAVCDLNNEQIKNDALNAARNMYLYQPSLFVTQALAMIEAAFNHKQEAIDYQAQAIFLALSQKFPKEVIDALKADLELYKKGKHAKNAFKAYDIDINPKRANKIN